MVVVAGWERVRGATVADGAGRTLHFAVVFDFLPLILDALYGLRKSTVVLVLGLGSVTKLWSADELCVVLPVACLGVVD